MCRAKDCIWSGQHFADLGCTHQQCLFQEIMTQLIHRQSAASCRSCFYSVSPCRRKCSPSFLERDVVPSTLIKFERRQTSLQPISPKLVNSHQNNLGCLIALQVRGEICSLRFYFRVNCTFKFDCRHPVFPAVTANMLSASSSVSNHKEDYRGHKL